jgi:DNA-binding transcriptional regulator YiaG
VIQEIDRLLDHHTEREIAVILNEKEMRSGEGKRFHRGIIVHLKHDYDLTDRFSRLRAHGMLTAREIAARLGISVASVKAWRDRGLLCAHRYNDKGECLFELPAQDLPQKGAWKRSYLQQKKLSANAAAEVQCEA